MTLGSELVQVAHHFKARIIFENLHIAAYYRPNEKDEHSLDELEKSLHQLGERDDGVIIAGDFNFPGWDWKQSEMKSGCHYPLLHSRFIDILNNTGLTQLVEEPTREKNTLYLLCTNLPGKFNRVEVFPGISDHCAVIAEVEVKPAQRSRKPKKIYLYKKADWSQMAVEISRVSEEMESLQHSNLASRQMSFG